jgi:hypothetical protein
MMTIQDPADNQPNGIEGQVIIRPVSPVERPGMANYRPYQAHVRVLDEQGRLVADFRSRPDGHFEVHLAPGAYVLRPESDAIYPRAQEQTVTVEKNRFTSVRITYDSGMR